jgi:thioredoxin reductase (NADPH)
MVPEERTVVAPAQGEKQAVEKIVIIGSGPAGFTAGIYAARANMVPLMYEGFISGGPAGGQLINTTEIENFPGFPEGVSGPDLMARMKEQFLRFKPKLLSEDVVSVNLSKRPFTIRGTSAETECQVLIIATGATARLLGLPAEQRLWNRGMSACAVCDGGLPIFRNKDLVVVGGGDTAVEEALYLTKFAGRVFLVHRRDQLRASPVMQERLFACEKVTPVWNSVLEDVKGQNRVEGAVLRNVKTGALNEMAAGGVFYAIGHTPNTAFLNGQLPLTDAGYIITQPGSTVTPVKGVFACGDVQDARYRQAVTAAGSGCQAALDARDFLDGIPQMKGGV